MSKQNSGDSDNNLRAIFDRAAAGDVAALEQSLAFFKRELLTLSIFSGVPLLLMPSLQSLMKETEIAQELTRGFQLGVEWQKAKRNRRRKTRA